MTDKFSSNTYGIADAEGFSTLVDAYYVSLTTFAYRILGDRGQAEDTVQDVFAKLWSNRKKYDRGVPLKNYLYVSTRNAAYNRIRSSRRMDARVRELPTSEDSFLYMIEEETNRMLLMAIDRLSAGYSDVIRLSLAELPQEEIARQLGIAVPTVKAIKAKAIKELRKIIDELS